MWLGQADRQPVQFSILTAVGISSEYMSLCKECSRVCKAVWVHTVRAACLGWLSTAQYWTKSRQVIIMQIL